MQDSFITAINTQRTTTDWMNLIIQNMTNMYTPGYREIMGNFKTCLDGIELDETLVKVDQGKSFPGTSPANVFLEGVGYFGTKTNEGKMLYTRLGEFNFDGEGVYKSKEGYSVQGYILDDNGEVMASPIPQNSDPNTASTAGGGPSLTATSDIKLWIDPSNGKYLGKYDEYEIKEDGIIYGKANQGKIKVPLYKIALFNFHNPQALNHIAEAYFSESRESGKPVAGRGDIRSGLIEMANTDFRGNIAYLQQAKLQLEMTNKLISTNKQLLEEAMKLLQ